MHALVQRIVVFAHLDLLGSQKSLRILPLNKMFPFFQSKCWEKPWQTSPETSFTLLWPFRIRFLPTIRPANTLSPFQVKGRGACTCQLTPQTTPPSSDWMPKQLKHQYVHGLLVQGLNYFEMFGHGGDQHLIRWWMVINCSHISYHKKKTFTAPSDASSFIHHPNLLVSPFPPVRLTSSRFKGTHWNCCAAANLPSRCGSVQIHVPGRQLVIPKIDPFQWNPSWSTMEFQFMDNNSPRKTGSMLLLTN